MKEKRLWSELHKCTVLGFLQVCMHMPQVLRSFRGHQLRLKTHINVDICRRTHAETPTLNVGPRVSLWTPRRSCARAQVDCVSLLTAFCRFSQKKLRLGSVDLRDRRVATPRWSRIEGSIGFHDCWYMRNLPAVICFWCQL